MMAPRAGVAAARAWHWIMAPAKYRPRRITVTLWTLLWLSWPFIDSLLKWYQKPLLRADEWVLAVLAPVTVVFGLWIWWRGRGTRSRRRERKAAAS